MVRKQSKTEFEMSRKIYFSFIFLARKHNQRKLNLLVHRGVARGLS